jgi:ankyrin repeat protein
MHESLTMSKSLISIASRNGSLRVVNILVKAGASINTLDESGYAPIHWAASGGFLDMVCYLAESNADLNLLDSNSQPPLYKAAQGVTVKLESKKNAGSRVKAQEENRVNP